MAVSGGNGGVGAVRFSVTMIEKSISLFQDFDRFHPSGGHDLHPLPPSSQQFEAHACNGEWV